MIASAAGKLSLRWRLEIKTMNDMYALVVKSKGARLTYSIDRLLDISADGPESTI